MSDESGSVFPVEHKQWVPASANDPRGHKFIERANGLTKRELLAAMIYVEWERARIEQTVDDLSRNEAARESVLSADSLLAELAK
jgi:hypothetical protein